MTLVPTSTFYRIIRGFQRICETVWRVDRGRLLLRTPTHVPSETCMCSTCWGKSLSKTCHYISGLCTSNIPRYFLDFASCRCLSFALGYCIRSEVMYDVVKMAMCIKLSYVRLYIHSTHCHDGAFSWSIKFNGDQIYFCTYWMAICFEYTDSTLCI